MAPVAARAEREEVEEAPAGSGRIASLILDRPTCLMCLGRGVDASPTVVRQVLRGIDRTLRVYEDADSSCRVCGSNAFGPVYSLRRHPA